VTAEVFGSSATGVGGVAAQIGSDVPSIMTGLLSAYGGELEAWLAERGIGNPVKVILPSNNRESVQ
jgi:hypothetical protein